MAVTFAQIGESRTNTRGKGGVEYTVDNVFGRVLVVADGPQVFLVHQSPHDTTHPHYHDVPQFQVFTRGGGTFGREDVSAPTIHYADAFTSYGPIVSADDGVEYFTARISSDVGAHYMPESRKEKTQKSGRHFTIALEPERQTSGSAANALAEYEDGLAAYRLDLEPGHALQLPAMKGAGRLLTILTGSVLTPSGEFGVWSWGHCAPGDEIGPEYVAGPAGAVVICLDYPQR